MIWSRGEILPDDGLAINAADRTFEHGLGLFETLRTWGGVPALLGRHRARMLASARALGLAIEPADFPDAEAVARLLDAEAAGDRMLRITATGGSPGGRSLIWMRSAPVVTDDRVLSILAGGWSSASDDPMSRHKSLNYWSRRIAFEGARARGFDETLSLLDDGTFGEGSRSNLFLIRGRALLTPTVGSPIVPGVMRGFVLEVVRSIGWDVREVGGISRSDLESADEVFLTNAVRGLMGVGSCEISASGPPSRLAKPIDRTARLKSAISDRLYAQGGSR